ncbi:HDOD domain-containing protein [Thiolapillus sp.]
MSTAEPTDPQSVEELKRFTPLSDLSYDKLLEIVEKAQWLKAKKRSQLMDLGDTEDSSLFLLRGNVLMEAADGRQRVIKHTDTAARSPLSRLRPSRYRVSALTPVHYIKISNALLDELTDLEDSSEMISSHYLVEETSEGNADFSSQVVARIYEDLQKHVLRMLSWHPVALGVSRQILAQPKDVSAIAGWVLLDPVLALKFMKSAQFQHRPSGSVPNVASATSQMGSQKARKLAFMNLFRESRDPRTLALQEAFRNAWERSVSVAAVAKRLAAELGRKDPAEAELAGLLHNIGETTIISYAYSYYREVSVQELHNCTLMFGKETGRMVLSHWNIHHSLAQNICDATEWLHDHGRREPDLSDIVIAARACIQISRKDESNPPPPLPQIPALKRLRLDTPNSILATELRTFADSYLEETKLKLGIE